MRRPARVLFAALTLHLSACARPEATPTRLEPAPLAAAAPVPAPTPVVRPNTPTHCTIPADGGEEQRALATWLASNLSPEGFTCPPTLRVVQREPWHVADSDLGGGEEDDVGGPTRRTSLGERVFFWGVDPGSGDSLLVSIGRVDAPSLVATQQRLAGRPDGLREPSFDKDGQRLDGPWRGLTFLASPAATARALRTWLAEVPPGTLVESYPIGWEPAFDEDEVPARPRLVHLRGPLASTLCIETAARRGCWSTSAVEIDEAGSELRDDDDDGPPSAEFPPVELTVWTGRSREQWRLDGAGRWTVVGGASTRRGRLRRIASDRRFTPATLAPVRDSMPTLWVRSLTGEWLAAGGFASGSQGLVQDARWIFRRQSSGWRFGALDGDDVRDHLVWPDGQTIGLVLGWHERGGGDGLAYADGRLWLFSGDGEWLRPTGRLPLPTRGMAMLRTAGGWDYEYSLTANPPHCLDVALARSISWRTDAGGHNRRESTLRLPMADLQGRWSLGPDGLARGC